jgi:ABC-type Co2+ transport system permease subunit
MQINWNTAFIFQILIWLVVLFEWKRLKRYSKTDRNTLVAILSLTAIMSLFYLDSLPGPITLLHYIFSPLGTLME